LHLQQQMTKAHYEVCMIMHCHFILQNTTMKSTMTKYVNQHLNEKDMIHIKQSLDST